MPHYSSEGAGPNDSCSTQIHDPQPVVAGLDSSGGATTTTMEPLTAHSVAELTARFLAARSVDQIFGLQGGHIQPLWDHLARLGVRIVDVRDEGAAVHMAHAQAMLDGTVGIVL